MNSRNINHRWAIIVGVNHYQDRGIRDLRFAVNDALSLHELLGQSRETGYGARRMSLMTSRNPEEVVTRIDILAQLMEKAKKAKENDLLMFYFSGHGDFIDGDAYLLPADAKRKFLLADTAVSLQRIKEIMQTSAARIKVIILDACDVGATLGTKAASANSQAFMKSVMDRAKGIAIFASSSLDEASWEDANKEHGVFTYYFLQALSGAASKNKSRSITLKNVVNYVTTHVEDWARQNNLDQCPTLKFEFEGREGDIDLFTLPKKLYQGEAVISANGDSTQTNPIYRTFPIAVKAVEDFFGRYYELQDIRQILSATTDMPIAIIGDRGSGKSSMLNRIKKLLEEPGWNGRQLLSFAMSPTGIFTYKDFSENLWDSLVCAVQSANVNVPELLDKSIPSTTINRFVAELNKLSQILPEFTFVVFIDEFGQIIHQCNDLESNKIEGLINHIVEKTEIPLVFVLSLLRALPDSYGSPFPRRPIHLPPFSEEDASEMVTSLLGGYAAMPVQSQLWLYEYTGGQPFFLKLIMAKLFDVYEFGKSTQEITIDMLQTAANSACGSARAREILQDVYKTYFTEAQRYVVIGLAYAKRPFSLNELRQAGASVVTAARQLKERHFLMFENDQVTFRLQFLGDWLQHWAEFPSEVERLLTQEEISTQSGTIQQTINKETTKKGVYIDKQAERVYVNGEEVEAALTNLEFKALVYLATRVGGVVSKDELANAIYPGDYYEGDDARISTLVYRLRNAIGDRKPYQHILTLRKRGYRIKDIALLE